MRAPVGDRHPEGRYSTEWQYNGVEGGKRILLAEDDREMRILLTWELERNGYEVVEAENGLDLLRHLGPAMSGTPGGDDEPEYDLVVSDVRMPGLSGLEILAALRKRNTTLPVILITAFGDDATLRHANQLGVTAMLDKPFETLDLLVAIERALPSL